MTACRNNNVHGTYGWDNSRIWTEYACPGSRKGEASQQLHVPSCGRRSIDETLRHAATRNGRCWRFGWIGRWMPGPEMREAAVYIYYMCRPHPVLNTRWGGQASVEMKRNNRHIPKWYSTPYSQPCNVVDITTVVLNSQEGSSRHASDIQACPSFEKCNERSQRSYISR